MRQDLPSVTLLVPPPQSHYHHPHSSSHPMENDTPSFSDDVSLSSTFTADAGLTQKPKVHHPSSSSNAHRYYSRRTERATETSVILPPPETAVLGSSSFSAHLPQQTQFPQQQQTCGLPAPRAVSPQHEEESPDAEATSSLSSSWGCVVPVGRQTTKSKSLFRPHGAQRVMFDLSRNQYAPQQPSTSTSGAALSVTTTSTDTTMRDDSVLYDVESRWYNGEDYKRFKYNVIKTVKSVLKAQDRRARDATRKPFSYTALIEPLYDTCFAMELEQVVYLPRDQSILAPHEQANLLRLYRTSLDTECVLGLERLLVTKIGKDRSELRASLMHTLQDLQHHFFEQQQQHQEQEHASRRPSRSRKPRRVNLDDPHCQILAENMCQISLEVSRPSRLFARYLAATMEHSVVAERAAEERAATAGPDHQDHRDHKNQTVTPPPPPSSRGASSSAGARRNSH